MEDLLNKIRDAGWAVAVHNDYKILGHKYTFWLFTNGDRCLKGEGSQDRAVLQGIWETIARLKSLETGKDEKR